MDSQNVVKMLNNSSHPMFNVAGEKNHSISQENGIINDAEISIFEAHKYFSEESNDIKRQEQGGINPSHDLPCIRRLSSLSSVEGSGRNIFRSKSLRATRTASSEASWNSQTSLLSNPPGSTGVSLKDHASNCRSRRWSAAKKWFIKRNCCCSTGEKSVRVEEKREPIVVIETMKSSNRNSNKMQHTDGNQRCSIVEKEIHHIKAMAPNASTAITSSSSSSMDAPRQQRISASGRPFIDGTVGFTFPILASSAPIAAKSTGNPLEDTVMEGFLQAVPSSMETNHVREDDVGSDASSDLFEIEGFSTQTASCPMHFWWESSVDENSNNAVSLVLENGITDVQHCQRSVDEATTVAETESFQLKATSEASGTTLRPPREEVGGGEGKRKDNGSMLMSCREEKVVAEGPPLVPLHVAVGGRPPRGSSPSSPLSVAFMA